MQNYDDLRSGDRVKLRCDGSTREMQVFGVFENHFNVNAGGKVISARYEDIESILYKFQPGDRARNSQTGGEAMVSNDALFSVLNFNPCYVRLKPSCSAEVFEPLGDIFHVEKRLRAGKRLVGGVTVAVTPDQTPGLVTFNIKTVEGKFYNAEELRAIASLLNEIADCL